jgi:hypothetical protein
MSDEERGKSAGVEVNHPQLPAGWSEARTERLLAGVKTRIGRRARLRRALVASAALASVFGLGAVVRQTVSTTGGPAVADAARQDAPAAIPGAASPRATDARPPARATASSSVAAPRPRWRPKRWRPATETRLARPPGPIVSTRRSSEIAH